MERIGAERAQPLLGQEVRPRALMRPYGLYYLYRRRLQYHAAQELFAGLGIVIAVALVFATLIASGSIAGSAAQVVKKVVGRADLQLRSISPEGFSEHLLSSVEALPGIKAAAPLLEVPASVRTQGGRELNVTLLGADVALGVLDGLSHTVPGAVFSERAIGLSAASARALGISPAGVESPGGAHVAVAVRGRAYQLKVSTVLGPEAVGALSGVLSAAMPLEDLQAISGLKGRVSRILVQSERGRRAQVQGELRRLAAGRIEVAPADQDVALLSQALGPSDLASSFFAAVAALLGFLLAFNAVLLTVPERRAQIADLRLAGARSSALIQLLIFQALCLGIAASLVGLGIGYVLAVAVFHQRPGYLSQAFVLGEGIQVGAGPALLGLAGGIVATCLASLLPLADMRPGRALDAPLREEGEPGNALDGRFAAHLAAAALLLIALAGAIYAADPALALLGCVALALACVAAMPLLFSAVVGSAAWVSRHSRRLTALPVAVMSLQRTRLRSLALLSTGAVALFGAVALGGARGDLLGGLEQVGQANVAVGQLWLITPDDVEVTDTFRAAQLAERIARVPGVSEVQALHDTFANLGGSRIVVLAWPRRAARELLPSQILTGNVARAEQRVAEGGSIAITRQLAEKLHLSLSGELKLPTPSGTARLQVAALTTDFGWPGGGVMMSAAEIRRLWQTSAPTALVARLRGGTNVQLVRRRIAGLLGTDSGLEVITARTGDQRFMRAANAGLGELQWIALMLEIAAILALTAALIADLWRQRVWAADLRLSNVPSYRLRRIMLTRAALTAGSGGLAGVLGGLFAQAILDAYLKHVTGFPLMGFADAALPIETLALVLGVALLLAAPMVWRVSRAPMLVALEGQ
ncbi:MAG TPA: FtsX-like permease family protein [Solirubrobacteraceae bacterium]|nr:FtsX-like permease family protein [Solirubrobacteraceae bacterium]